MFRASLSSGMREAALGVSSAPRRILPSEPGPTSVHPQRAELRGSCPAVLRGIGSIPTHPPAAFSPRGSPSALAPFPYQRGWGGSGVPGAFPVPCPLTLGQAALLGASGTAGHRESHGLGSVIAPRFCGSSAAVQPWNPVLSPWL